MAKYKKKPVLPIYAIAVVWVIYTLIHPLYQVSDYVSVILISVVVFIVAKGVFPTIEDGPAIPPELVHHAPPTPETPSEAHREEDPTEEVANEEKEKTEAAQPAAPDPSPENTAQNDAQD